MSDFNSLISEHWYLFVGGGLGAWWIVTRIIKSIDGFKSFIGTELEEKLPKVLKKELENGLGLFVKDKVRTEIDSAFASHEVREKEQIQNTLQMHEQLYHSRRK